MKGRVKVKEFEDKSIAFVGVGVSHIELIKRLATLGANIWALDKSPLNEELKTKLEGLGVKLRTGERYLEKVDADIYFRTPGLPFLSDEIASLRQNGKVVTSELEVFFELCPCKIIGVTGSDGKTTTTTIIYEILRRAGVKAHIGGNIGLPLLSRIDEIKESDVVVVELSSFQLESMRRSPDVAVVTNLTPNHLNIHKTMGNYVKAKEHIVRHQDAFSKTILSSQDKYFEHFRELSRGKVICFGKEKEAELYFKDGVLWDGGVAILNEAEIKVKGKHNVANFLAAIAATKQWATPEDVRHVAANFAGVEHRIEFCGELDEVKFFNDSVSTTPLRTMTSLATFEEPIILIAGGSDKGLAFDELGDEIARRAKCLILMGEMSTKIKNATKASRFFEQSKMIIEETQDMEEAIQIAMKHSQPGDVVLLAPACASYGLFRDFEERGRKFKAAVKNKIDEKRGEHLNDAKIN